MAQKYETALGVAGGERKQQSLLLWVGEWGDGFWLEGEWVRMMDEVPPFHEGRQGRIWGVSSPVCKL